jgi:threonine dehydrogenase-like Zn-dependent dehydrogenase
MSVIGSRNATRADFETVVAAIKTGGVRPADLVTHRTSLDGVIEKLPRWTHEKSGLVKALIEVS